MIVKTVVTLTILREVETLDAASDIGYMSLLDVAYTIDEGDWIGDYTVTQMDEVPQDKVNAELLELGNDGTFFQAEVD